MGSMEAPQPAKGPTDNEPELEEIIDMLECDSDASSDYDSDGKEIIHKSAAFFEHDEDTKDEADDIIFELKENGTTWWEEEYIRGRGYSIRELLYLLGVGLPESFRDKPDLSLRPVLIAAMHKILRRRERREEIWSPNHAIELIKSSKKIVVLTGAGISTSCGIPDFRSENGLYAELREKNEFDLEDPHQMFDIHYFKQHPHVFYSFAHKIYPSNFQPSPCHRFLALLEQKDKLLRNYTQNIDGLERKAGVQRVLQCHGSFSTATCVQCRTKVPGQDIEADILSQRVPYCRACAKAAPPRPKRKKAKKRKSGWQSDESEKEPPPNPSIMKPDITFFGEGLISDFDDLLSKDTEQADLLLIIGTSLQVAPVSEVVSLMPHSIPQILINKTRIKHANPDIVLLGDADLIVSYICERIGWTFPAMPATLPGKDPEPTDDYREWDFDSVTISSRVPSTSLHDADEKSGQVSGPTALVEKANETVITGVKVIERPFKKARLHPMQGI